MQGRAPAGVNPVSPRLQRGRSEGISPWGVDCTACHSDLKEVPHPAKLAPVACVNCHAGEQEPYAASLQGTAAARNDPYAPGRKRQDWKSR